MDPESFLDHSAADYHDKILKGWENLYESKRQRLYDRLKTFHNGSLALELGSADGIMTQKILNDFEKLVVVDGSQRFLDQIRQSIPSDRLELRLSLFEEFEPNERFDTIFMTHILEHLSDPVLLLKRAADWLAPEGRILVAVPNADSLHRYVGVALGLLPSRDAFNEQDKLLGHQRVYTPKLMLEHIQKSGMICSHWGGLMLKPLSNRQIEEQWSPELVDAFYKVGDELPQLCSEIYFVAEHGAIL